MTLGLGWTIDSDPRVLYGLHWIEATREVYVVRGPQMPVSPFPVDPDLPWLVVARDAYEAIVLGIVDSEELLRSVLCGWELVMPEANSLQWVRTRLWQAAQDEPDVS